MSDYQKKADMLKTWTVAEVRAHPELAVGQLVSAAAAIERLGAEVERLNRENFWLTREEQKVAAAEKGSMIELPPVKVGDTAYGIDRRGGGWHIKRGKVTSIEWQSTQVIVSVKGVCRGKIGERVFCTADEARAALECMKEEV